MLVLPIPSFGHPVAKMRVVASSAYYVAVLLAGISTVLGRAVEETWTKPPTRILQQSASDPVAPVVDLDYAQYQGYYNPAFNLNIYRGLVHMKLSACEGCR